MERIKVELLKHLTKSNKTEVAATEVETLPGFKADIASYNGKHYIEFEIKKVLHDVINGELNKPKKHRMYSKCDRLVSRIPNLFILVIPAEIVDDVKSNLHLLNSSYGIMTFTIIDDVYKFKTVKEPKVLHDKPASLIKKAIYKRMISDNVDLIKESKPTDLSDSLMTKDRRISFLERKLREAQEELNEVKGGFFKDVPLIAKSNVYAEKITIHYSDKKTKTIKIKS